MANSDEYVFNDKTLSYEVKKRSGFMRLMRVLLAVGGSVALAVLYMWIYTAVFGLELPKTKLLKKREDVSNSDAVLTNESII